MNVTPVESTHWLPVHLGNLKLSEIIEVAEFLE
jgi:hypothetical protein